MNAIGILTMHRVINHGSFLQAYALKRIIENNVAQSECHFIDIPISSNNIFDWFSKNNLNRIKLILHRMLRHTAFCLDVYALWQLEELRSIYIKQLAEKLNVTNERNYKTKYDSVIIGSDEVFNVTQDSPWGSTMLLFGQGINSSNIISYAGSFGDTTLESISNSGLEISIRNGFGNFRALSVRDQNSYSIVRELTGINPYIHRDPVLVYDFTYEIEKSNLNGRYILVYQYPNRISEKSFIKGIKRIAKKRNLKIISTYGYCDWADSNVVLQSFELLRYFRDSAFVITDTFHGCVLSIKYNKQFFVFCRDSNKNKVSDLLLSYGLENQIVNDDSIFDRINSEIDWSTINSKVIDERKRATEYLVSSLTFDRK